MEGWGIRKEAFHILLFFFREGLIGEGPYRHFVTEYVPVHEASLIPAGVAVVQIFIVDLHLSIRHKHGLAVDQKKISCFSHHIPPVAIAISL